MNFKEHSSGHLGPLNLNEITSDDRGLDLKLFTVNPDEAIRLILRLDIVPTAHHAERQASNRLPQTQTLETEQFVFMDGNKTYFLDRNPKNKNHVVQMVPHTYRELYGRDAGKLVDTTVWPVKADLRCEQDRIMLKMIGLPEEECQWYITIRGALYKGSYS